MYYYAGEQRRHFLHCKILTSAKLNCRKTLFGTELDMIPLPWTEEKIPTSLKERIFFPNKSLWYIRGDFSIQGETFYSASVNWKQ